MKAAEFLSLFTSAMDWTCLTQINARNHADQRSSPADTGSTNLIIQAHF